MLAFNFFHHFIHVEFHEGTLVRAISKNLLLGERSIARKDVIDELDEVEDFLNFVIGPPC